MTLPIPDHAQRHSRRMLGARVAGVLLLRIMLGLLALVAAVNVLISFGFFVSDEIMRVQHTVTRYVLYGFVVHGALALLLAKERRAYVRARVLQYIIVSLVAMYLLWPSGPLFPMREDPVNASVDALGSIYIFATQILALFAALPALLRGSARILSLRVRPGVVLAASFLFLILVGTMLLMLPRCSNLDGGLPFLDALFTSTSASCVTGLTVVDTSTAITMRGQFVLLLLMQAGGLGIMTITTFFASVAGSSAGLRERTTMQELLGEQSLGSIQRTVGSIAIVTLALETAGAVLLYSLRFSDAKASGDLFFAVFHSVSAFCNAGFSLAGNNLASASVSTNGPALLVIAALIILGGLGFPVLANLAALRLRWSTSQRRRTRLGIHARLALVASAVLLFGGWASFLLTEHAGALAGYDVSDRLLHGFFLSVTSRTAGFNTLPMETLSITTLLVLMLLMWIGASPASTGGGVKTVTIAAIALDAWHVLRGKRHTMAFGRGIPVPDIRRAHATVFSSLVLLFLALVLLAWIEPFSLPDLAFEAVSALGTVGLSRGITPSLSATGKIIIIVCMFIGRIGVYTAVGLFFREMHSSSGKPPDEHIHIT